MNVLKKNLIGIVAGAASLSFGYVVAMEQHNSFEDSVSKLTENLYSIQTEEDLVKRINQVICSLNMIEHANMYTSHSDRIIDPASENKPKVEHFMKQWESFINQIFIHSWISPLINEEIKELLQKHTEHSIPIITKVKCLPSDYQSLDVVGKSKKIVKKIQNTNSRSQHFIGPKNITPMELNEPKFREKYLNVVRQAVDELCVNETAETLDTLINSDTSFFIYQVADIVSRKMPTTKNENFIEFLTKEVPNILFEKYQELSKNS